MIRVMKARVSMLKVQRETAAAIYLIAALTIAGCSGGSGFSGSGGTASPREATKPTANATPASQTGSPSAAQTIKPSPGQPGAAVTPIANNVDPGATTGDGDQAFVPPEQIQPATTPAVPATPVSPAPPPVPANAITQGSFSVWTTPADPAPLQPYTITIQVNLPSNVSSYARTDLSGDVTGTDCYKQVINGDEDMGDSCFGGGGGAFDDGFIDDFGLFGFGPDQPFEFFGNGARLQMHIPGAENMVRDTIRVRSTLLNESQTLVITF